MNAAVVAFLQQFPVFAHQTCSSGLRFFLLLIVKTSNVMLLFYTTSEVYTNFGMVSATLPDGFSIFSYLVYYSPAGKLVGTTRPVPKRFFKFYDEV